MMNIQEEFEKFFKTQPTHIRNFLFKKTTSEQAWNACAELMQAEIDQKDDEIAALQSELAEFRNKKNWIRPYDHRCNLLPQFALYLPRLSNDTINKITTD